MNLTNIVKKAMYTTTASLALASPLYSAEKPADAQYQVQKSSSLEAKTLSIEDFKKPYGERWTRMNDSKRKLLTEKWNGFKEGYKKALIGIYSDYDNFYKNMTEEERRGYENFSRTELPDRKTEKGKTGKQNFSGLLLHRFFKGLGEAFLEEHYPWIIDADNLSKEEKLSIYIDLKLEENKSCK